jgi:hypothetical protein
MLDCLRPGLVGRLAAAGAVAASIAAALTPAADQASAARPVEGARYADGDYALTVELAVSKRGGRLDPRRSELRNVSDCAAPDFRLGTRDRPVHISRSGRFRYVGRNGRLVLRLAGRFVTKNRARVRFRYRRDPVRRARHCDDSGRLNLYPRRINANPLRDCRTHKAKTLVAGPSGRVFTQPGWDGGSWIPVAYACLFGADKRVELGVDDDDDHDIGLVRLAGPYVGYEEIDCVGLGCGYGVLVRDLRTGAKVRDSTDLDHSFGPVTDLELKENASVAWIARAAPYSPTMEPSVWAYDTAGPRQLATGAISLSSLELSGSTLTWVKDGAVSSAALD